MCSNNYIFVSLGRLVGGGPTLHFATLGGLPEGSEQQGEATAQIYQNAVNFIAKAEVRPGAEGTSATQKCQKGCPPGQFRRAKTEQIAWRCCKNYIFQLWEGSDEQGEPNAQIC